MDPTVNANAIDIAKLKSDIKTLFKNQDRHEEILKAVQSLATSAEATSKELSKVREDVEELKDRPRNRWEAIAMGIVLAVVGVIVGIVFSKIGLTP